jgi:hypothetical protein
VNSRCQLKRLTGPASPQRPVCAPGLIAFALYRELAFRAGAARHAKFSARSGQSGELTIRSLCPTLKARTRAPFPLGTLGRFPEAPSNNPNNPNTNTNTNNPGHALTLESVGRRGGSGSWEFVAVGARITARNQSRPRINQSINPGHALTLENVGRRGGTESWEFVAVGARITAQWRASDAKSSSLCE